ncbi:hypothetical protein FA13DRAFT_1813416 [Coprinellus micaceus]|uniref:Cleavage stimulation factor subunit 2 hinge domain-containing protein n=1 Tax=Coprinellus micaceus TaxID=71717 RepID=A0A4Y7TEB0_COPMI|nr:hypothetical protein FA13DRAFT_1813416 [Coprinellus micaceus]
MSADPNLATAQLLDLLLTLKSTTPTAAKGILNSQPAIAYALITLMVSMGAIKTDVFQKTLAASAAQGGAPKPQPAPTAVPPTMHMPPPMPPHMTPSHSHSSSSTPVPAIPPYLQQQNPYGGYRTGTPPHSTPTPPIGGPPPPGYGGYPPPNNGYGQQYPPGPPLPPSQYGGGYPPQGPPGYPAGPPPPQHHTPIPVPAPAPDLAATLAAIPEESRALVVRVVSMTPEQIHALPPNDRATYIQIRATLGIPTPGP